MHMPSNTAPHGPFTAVITKLKTLKEELSINAWKNNWSGGWLRLNLGDWKAMLIKVAISASIVPIVFFLLICLFISVVKRIWRRTLIKQINLAAETQLVQLEMIAVNHPSALQHT